MQLHPICTFILALVCFMLFGYFFGAFVSGIWNVMCWDAEGRLLLALFGLVAAFITCAVDDC